MKISYRFGFWLLLYFLCMSCSTVRTSLLQEEAHINKCINEWHHAAAVADEAAFFSFLEPDAIYIGTDPSERWTGRELEEWSRPFFAKDSAWNFTTIERNIVWHNKKSIVWFDELLNTWMGICRASGVLVKKGNSWFLRHYHLSVAIPNEDMQQYLKINE